jgi:UDP-3-O-[3-hydroxymyristoyl] N-acetylglucosamine deacetylase
MAHRRSGARNAPTHFEHTLARPVRVAGIGLRSGLFASAHLRPTAPGTGRVFVLGSTRIPARLEHVVDTRLATILGVDGVRVSLVEHLCAALYATGIDNVEITVEGGELPALDGSSVGWTQLLVRAGRTQQRSRCSPLVVRDVIEVRAGASWARLEPAERLELDVRVAFDHPAIGTQRYTGVVDARTFERELAWARTFGFYADAEALRAMGIARGATLENTLVFDEAGPMNGLRARDEVVRHKALDAVGDLALVGRPLHGRLVAERPGHALHVALLTKLLEQGG